jgi:hypothetical protein
LGFVELRQKGRLNTSEELVHVHGATVVPGATRGRTSGN